MRLFNTRFSNLPLRKLNITGCPLLTIKSPWFRRWKEIFIRLASLLLCEPAVWSVSEDEHFWRLNDLRSFFISRALCTRNTVREIFRRCNATFVLFLYLYFYTSEKKAERRYILQSDVYSQLLHVIINIIFEKMFIIVYKRAQREAYLFQLKEPSRVLFTI